MRVFTIGLSIIFLLAMQVVNAQEHVSGVDRVLSIPDKLFGTIDSKTAQLEEKLVAQTSNYLRRLAKQEKKLQRKMAKLDSSKAKEVFGDIDARYNQLQQKLTGTSGRWDHFSNVYSGHLDSLQTAFKFLDNNSLLAQTSAVQDKMKKAMGSMSGWQNKLNQTEEIKKILAQRQLYLKEKLGQLGATKAYRKFQQEVYYYKAQVEAYKNIFENPTLLEEKLLSLLSETKFFQNFFANNSALGALFNLPGNSNPVNQAAAIAGLQTRASLQQDLQARLGAGPNINQMVQQNIGNAQSQLNSLKDKLSQLSSNGGGEVDMPDFKPNSNRTKSFLKRIEIGSDMQSIKSNTYFPTTTDFSFSAAYKISDRSKAGIGLSQKIGWGKNIQNIKFSYQGIGFRSFVDIRIKNGGFWISAGGELNYKSQFRDFSILNNFSPWQKSALLGLKKVYQAGKMKGTMSLLYDFLYKNKTPYESPFVFRVGYQFQKK
jgi:hypothetical protein